MGHTAVTLEDLLSDFEETATRWQDFFQTNPGAASLPCDIARSANIGALVWHIYAAAYRHAERLLGEPVTDLETQTPVKNIAGAFTLEVAAAAKIRQFLQTTNEAALSEAQDFVSRTGFTASTSRRKLCLHIFVHAIRHWAHIGTLVRQGGYPVPWPQDILFSKVIR